MFTWNYRFVNLPGLNGGEDWLVLCEVSYNSKKRPTGFAMETSPSRESMTALRADRALRNLAYRYPVLQTTDFKFPKRWWTYFYRSEHIRNAVKFSFDLNVWADQKKLARMSDEEFTKVLNAIKVQVPALKEFDLLED